MGKEMPCLALGVYNRFLVVLNQANGHFCISFCYNKRGKSTDILAKIRSCSL